MIDVHRRVVAATLEDRIDESLERLLFFVRRQRPELLVTNATAAVTEGVPEEVVEAAVLRLPIAFEIQKDVERRWLRKRRQPVTLLDFEQLVGGPAGDAGLELDAGLLSHPDERLDAPPVRFAR